MTQATPPGWYPDPGQTSDGPRAERWWNGSAWTDQVRPAQVAGPYAPPAYPAGAPMMPPGAPGAARRGPRTAIAAVVAVVVLACIGGGVYALTGNDKAGESSAPKPETSHNGGGLPHGPGGSGGSGGSGEPDTPQSPGPQVEDGYAVDMASGISLPVPDGWKGQSGTIGAQLTIGDYKCPGDTSQKCSRGGVSSAPAAALKLSETTAKAAAKADISKNAEQSYGGSVYGEISSHDELASKAVDVAGQKGYLVRWKVVTSKGDDGYVESLAFPSPADSSMLVVVRFGFDVNAKAPKVSEMDTITKGIKSAGTAGGGAGGSGKQV
ncbi:DUF2510 domain-containing protein [Streptomyces odontomachi]|uniref:DUF2510 domain-containing protein n=1 Tax=Streptomyces odontomachi TaxID=2944940 RepID=UPI002108E632|nr:DUF2510 domain-containing protein [Streptomyces sp. ODS25]